MPFAPPQTARKTPLKISKPCCESVTIRTFTNVAVLPFLSTKIYDLPSAPSESSWKLSQNPPPATSSPSTENTPGVLRNCPCRVPFKCVWIPNNVPQPNSSWHRAGVKGSRGARSHGQRGRKEMARRTTRRVRTRSQTSKWTTESFAG